MSSVVEEIRFYRASDKPYGAFSNLFRRPIMFEGETYETSEHAYQAGKPRRPAVKKWLMAAPSPALLAMAAHGLYYWDIAPGWSQTKFDRMRRVLAAKFTQHDDLRELLLSTGDAILIETATVDNDVNRLWGQVNGIGQNMLGIMLMDLRSELRNPTKLLDHWLAQYEHASQPSALAVEVVENDTDIRTVLDDVLDVLVRALPFVEESKRDAGYKTGAVERMVKDMRDAIVMAGKAGTGDQTRNSPS